MKELENKGNNMTYDFDSLIERKGTNSLKYDFMEEEGKPSDVLPLWVADMDFRAPDAVTEALIQASRHGIFGYSEVKLPYFQAVHDWFQENHNWDPKAEWLVKTPGVVYAVCTAIRALTNPGDAVLIQRPVYYPFSRGILENKRKLVNNPLCFREGRYTVDLKDFERKIIENQVKLFILCNPHNPVGRVWTAGELSDMGEVCRKHQVTVVSDEIHADFTFPGHRHTVFAGIKPEYSNMTITCTAPSKTFNLAGLQVSNIFIENNGLRRAFRKEMLRSGYLSLNTMGLVACQAAYRHGYPWLIELRKYLGENLEYVRNFLNRELPQIRLVEPEGTYLLWLDFRALGMEDEQLNRFILEEAKLWLDRGSLFGPEGEGFQRINMACPRATLEEAFSRLRDAVRLLNPPSDKDAHPQVRR